MQNMMNDYYSQTIVNPLCQRSKGRKSNIILGAYECHQVFMNIEEIHKVNSSFYSDLQQHSSSSQPCIGMLFNRHVGINDKEIEGRNMN